MSDPMPVRQVFENLPLFQETKARAIEESEKVTTPDNHATPDGPPVCMKCKRTPREIPDLVFEAGVEEETPEDYAKQDGTYVAEFNMFVCNVCYIAIGMPTNADIRDMMPNAYSL